MRSATAAAGSSWSRSPGRACSGHLGRPRPLPRDVLGEKFADKGYYFAGDGARLDDDGDVWLLGRVDDVMNVSGHRLSTARDRVGLVGHEGVAEAAVVGALDETTGQAVVAFVIIRAAT